MIGFYSYRNELRFYIRIYIDQMNYSRWFRGMMFWYKPVWMMKACIFGCELKLQIERY